MRKTYWLAGLALVAMTNAAGAATPEQVAQAALAAAPVWDGHNDVPEQLRDRRKDVLAGFDFADTSGTADAALKRGPMQTDLARLRKGHVGAQFWSVFVSAALPEPQAVQATLEQIDVIKRVIAQNPQSMQFASSADDVVRAMKAGKVASLIGMEGGHSIGGSLGVLRQMYALGARYMTLTHFKNNDWADSGTDAPAHNGLTPFGKDVVREMQRLGMLVDLSHVSEKTMLDAMEVAGAPVIFSHSGAMGISGHPRNVSDAALDRLKANGGLIMVNFYPGYVSPQLRAWNADRAGEQARAKALYPDSPDRALRSLADWDAAHAKPVATLAQVADHIDYIAKRIGADHVGLGSDFDGGSEGLAGLPDVSAYPALFVELARRGWLQADLQKLSNGNMLRVLRAAEAYATAHRADPPIENATGF
ncbi:MAG: dipeptidase [Novosphingobium sp.]